MVGVDMGENDGIFAFQKAYNDTVNQGGGALAQLAQMQALKANKDKMDQEEAMRQRLAGFQQAMAAGKFNTGGTAYQPAIPAQEASPVMQGQQTFGQPVTQDSTMSLGQLASQYGTQNNNFADPTQVAGMTPARPAQAEVAATPGKLDQRLMLEKAVQSGLMNPLEYAKASRELDALQMGNDQKLANRQMAWEIAQLKAEAKGNGGSQTPVDVVNPLNPSQGMKVNPSIYNEDRFKASGGKDRTGIVGTGLKLPGTEKTPVQLFKEEQDARKQVEKQNTDQTSLAGATNSFDRLANSANELLNHPGLAGISGLRGAIPNIPGSQAADAQALLNTLKSQVGFGVLQDMRNMSKTGGALGNVSDNEGKRLEANLSPLEKPQSIEQITSSLKKIINYTNEAKTRLNNAYSLKYKDSQSGEQSSTPSLPKTINFNELK